MSPNFVSKSGEPFYCGAFVGLDWLDRHAGSTREEFAQAYRAVEIEQGSCEVVMLPNGETSLKYFPVTYDDVR